MFSQMQSPKLLSGEAEKMILVYFREEKNEEKTSVVAGCFNRGGLYVFDSRVREGGELDDFHYQ